MSVVSSNSLFTRNCNRAIARHVSTDTIFALFSGRSPVAIAVSGRRAAEAITALGGKLPEPRRTALDDRGQPAAINAV